MLVRDPYYWVDAMRRKPWHATEHFGLNWKDFVSKPWTMDRVGLDLEIDGVVVDTASSGNDPRPNVTCQENYQYHQIVSCIAFPFPKDHYFMFKGESKKQRNMFERSRPFYEMHYDTGKPYDSLLELRRDKILNFLSTTNYSHVRDHVVVNYEKLIREGTGFLVKYVEAATGAKATCRPA